MKKPALLLLALAYFLFGHTQSTQNKIPIDGKRWYQLNNTSNGLEGLFDGDTIQKVQTGYGKILSNYDSYYPLLDGEEFTIEGVRFYDGEGIFTKSPVTLFVITDKWQKIPIAKFTGEKYKQWVGPDPLNPKVFTLQTPIKNARYLVINSYSNFPTEVQVLGSSYKQPNPVSAAPKKSIQLKQMFGVNAFEWNFEDAQTPLWISEEKFAAVKSFRGVRHYMDWQKLESTEGGYTFSPTHSGGWGYDTIYQRCKEEGIEVLACLKTLPKWMIATYPDSLQDYENVPARYGSDLLNPMSYIEQAKVAFQFAARYGKNKNINPSLVTVNPKKRWTSDIPNQVKIGLGLIKYIECDNERDKWWKGRQAYQTGREYAANLSAFYDGNKNTMGPGVGVKNADPEMKVVIGGIASDKTDYIKGIVDWCKEFRGYKADGSVDLCFDVINYHFYANDGVASQGGYSSRGAAPEVSKAAASAKAFVEITHQYAQDLPVWITETGYDINQGSPLKAIPIGEKTVLQTQADWILRTALLYARYGIEGVFFYQLYDNAALNPGKFNTMGLINADKTRRPAADYLYQVNKLMGNYYYKETLHDDPVVDRYELNGQSAYVLVIPDEKGRTANYTLDLGETDSVKIYSPAVQQDSMTVKTAATTNGQLEITVTETPVFVIPEATNGTSKTNTNPTDTTATNNNNNPTDSSNSNPYTRPAFAWPAKANIYPNPSSEHFFLEVENGSVADVKVNIYNSSGNLCKSLQLEKQTDKLFEKIPMNSLPNGLYIIEIIQGNQKIIKKIIKTFS